MASSSKPIADIFMLRIPVIVVTSRANEIRPRIKIESTNLIVLVLDVISVLIFEICGIASHHRLRVKITKMSMSAEKDPNFQGPRSARESIRSRAFYRKSKQGVPAINQKPIPLHYLYGVSRSLRQMHGLDYEDLWSSRKQEQKPHRAQNKSEGKVTCARKTMAENLFRKYVRRRPDLAFLGDEELKLHTPESSSSETPSPALPLAPLYCYLTPTKTATLYPKGKPAPTTAASVSSTEPDTADQCRAPGAGGAAEWQPPVLMPVLGRVGRRSACGNYGRQHKAGH